MTRRQRFRLERIRKGLLRRRWLILLPTLLITGAAAAAAFTLPELYRSSTRIRVSTDEALWNPVRPAGMTHRRLRHRIDAVGRAILSRSRLEPVIRRYGLCGEGGEGPPMEQIVEHVRRSIEIDGSVPSGGDPTSRAATVSIRFTGREPVPVMRVTRTLASMFIEEVLDVRRGEIRRTLEHLHGEIAGTRARLKTIESVILDSEAMSATRIADVDRARLIQEHESLRGEYNALLSSALRTEIAEIPGPHSRLKLARVIQGASFPEEPIEPKRSLILAFGLLLGLGVGIGSAFLVELLDRSFRDVRDVKAKLKLPVLAVVPFIAGDETPPVKTRLRRFILGTP